MTVTTKCKFCAKPLSLEADEDYLRLASAGEGPRGRVKGAGAAIACSPFNPETLLTLVACDRCADMRRQNIDLCKQLQKVANALTNFAKPSQKLKDASREAVVALTKRYVRMVAEYINEPTLAWEEAYAEQIMDNPQEFRMILRAVWKVGRGMNRLLWQDTSSAANAAKTAN